MEKMFTIAGLEKVLGEEEAKIQVFDEEEAKILGLGENPGCDAQGKPYPKLGKNKLVLKHVEKIPFVIQTAILGPPPYFGTPLLYSYF